MSGQLRYISHEEYSKRHPPKLSQPQLPRVARLFTAPADVKLRHTSDRIRCLVRADLVYSIERLLPTKDQAMSLEALPYELLEHIFKELPYETLKQLSECSQARLSGAAGNVMLEQLAQGLSAYVGRGTVSREQIHAKQRLNETVRNCRWQRQSSIRQDELPTNILRKQAGSAQQPGSYSNSLASLQTLPVEILLQILRGLSFSALRNLIRSGSGSATHVAETMMFERRSRASDYAVGDTGRQRSEEWRSGFCPRCPGSVRCVPRDHQNRNRHLQGQCCMGEDQLAAKPIPPVSEKGERYLNRRFVLVMAQDEEGSAQEQAGVSVIRRLGSYWWVLCIEGD